MTDKVYNLIWWPTAAKQIFTKSNTNKVDENNVTKVEMTKVEIIHGPNVKQMRNISEVCILYHAVVSCF